MPQCARDQIVLVEKVMMNHAFRELGLFGDALHGQFTEAAFIKYVQSRLLELHAADGADRRFVSSRHFLPGDQVLGLVNEGGIEARNPCSEKLCNRLENLVSVDLGPTRQ